MGEVSAPLPRIKAQTPTMTPIGLSGSRMMGIFIGSRFSGGPACL